MSKMIVRVLFEVWVCVAIALIFFDMGGADACNSTPVNSWYVNFAWPIVVPEIIYNHATGNDDYARFDELCYNYGAGK